MNNIYSVYDSCSGIFGDPFIAYNDADATRVFMFSLANPSVPQYIRDDSVLYGLGSFDPHSGTFACDLPHVVARGSTVVPFALC